MPTGVGGGWADRTGLGDGGLHPSVSVLRKGTVPSMCANQGPSSPPPEWMKDVRPGRLDVRLLSQGTFWATREGVVLRLDHMSARHLQEVAGMLRDGAVALHLRAMIDALNSIHASRRSGVLSGDTIEFYLTGSSIAHVDARVWVESLPLMRAIDRELAKPD